MAAASLILVHLVEQRELGERFRRMRAAWPLHITLVPWFAVEDEPDFRRTIARYARTVVPFDVAVGSEALFGPNQDVPVSLITDQVKLQALHYDLSKIVSEFATEMTQDKRTFRPHITHHEASDGMHRRFAGDTEHIDSVTLVRLIEHGELCEVVQHFPLGRST